MGWTKKALNAVIGFFPNASNTMKPMTSVASVAQTGPSHTASREGCGRASKSNLIDLHERRCAPLSCRGPRAGHQHADFLGRRFMHRLRRGQPALRDHRKAVADLHQLVQLFRNDQNGDTVIAEIDQRLADLRGSTDVDTPGRLRGDQYPGALTDFAPHDELLQVPAGETARDRVRAGRLDTIGCDDSCGAR